MKLHSCTLGRIVPMDDLVVDLSYYRLIVRWSGYKIVTLADVVSLTRIDNEAH